MALFGKKSDPIEARSKALSREIAELEAKIKKLSEHPEPTEPKPRAIRPSAPTPKRTVAEPAPVFEPMPERPRQVSASATRIDETAHYNELGVRKYDLVSLLTRIKSHFQPRPTNNPKLIQLIAAGNLHGLRPLRYEKRVARNRFIFVLAILLLVIWGIAAMVRLR